MESIAQLRQCQKEFGLPTPLPPANIHLPAANGLANHLVDQKLQRLEQLASLGTLSAGLAHEIKNAMVAVRTFVDLLVAENKSAELASLVQQELKRIDSIVGQMLRCASNPKPQFARVSLHEILDRSLRLIEPQLRARNIRLKRKYLAEPDTLQGDAYQLEQAFLNVCLNAFDAVACDGEIRVGTSVLSSRPAKVKKSARRDLLQLAVEDSGSGISRDQLPRIFEPFFTSKPNGTGLGLPITREIIERHHGTISVQSQPNRGTTVRIALPIG